MRTHPDISLVTATCTVSGCILLIQLHLHALSLANTRAKGNGYNHYNRVLLFTAHTPQLMLPAIRLQLTFNNDSKWITLFPKTDRSFSPSISLVAILDPVLC